MATFRITKNGFVGNLSGSVTGSLLGTASMAVEATTASYVKVPSTYVPYQWSYVNKGSNGVLTFCAKTGSGGTLDYSESIGYLAVPGTVKANNFSIGDTSIGSYFTNTSSSTATSGTVTLSPNTYTKFVNTLTGNLTLSLGTASSSVSYVEYSGEFTVGSTAYSITWNGVTATVSGSPTIRANHKYLFSIVEGILILVEV